jgi:Prenyltransferase and squalene oxidase repeat
MAEVGELQRQLLAFQNPDGGWPFLKGSSWTEPTALALLALRLHDQSLPIRQAAASWLERRQNSDGGWRPNDAVPTSTWVTSLAILALPNASKQAGVWLAGHIHSKTGGSPWFPSTAGWVTPSATSILALSRLDSASFASQIEQSRKFLLSRRCRDGGWNHGGSSFRSENANSYPETTGLALLALTSIPSEQLTAAFRLSDDFLKNPGSTEGLSWLQMGLIAQGRKPDNPQLSFRPRTVRDISLRLLALAALDGRTL